MINKNLFLLFLGFVSLFLTTSCDNSTDETIYGNWVKGYQFEGDKRSHAVSFVIDETVYFGLGYNGTRSSRNQYFTDFNSYSGGTSWTSEAPFPGHQREGAFAFAVDGKGYLGCGYYGDTTEVYFSDVWQFDPAVDSANQWTQLADFPGGERTEATTFVVGGKGYVAGGRYESDATKKDCYEFNSATGTFEKVDGMGYKRFAAFSFVIGDRAYVGGGYDNALVTEFEYFDATTKTWNADGNLRDLYLSTTITDDISEYDQALNLLRYYASSFAVDGKGYLLGGNNGSVLSDCWEYDPETDIWTEKNSFESGMSSRFKASSFVVNGIPYVMAGQSGNSYLDDMWYFEPNQEEDTTD